MSTPNVIRAKQDLAAAEEEAYNALNAHADALEGVIAALSRRNRAKVALMVAKRRLWDAEDGKQVDFSKPLIEE